MSATNEFRKSTTENQKFWNDQYQWPQGGEEWSGPWGSSNAQWTMSIYPRIQPFLPAATILEIAPGFGRWTRFLKDCCRKLVVVDLSERCIDACRERFKFYNNIYYHSNDGKHLGMVADRSIDFAFSFDSLVHAEADTIEAYLIQLARKLTPDGVAFLHHSNMGHFAETFARQERLGRARRPLSRLGLVDATGHGRARSMTAELFLEFARNAGLTCISQELINWGVRPSHLIDCFSVVTLEGSKFARPYRLIENRDFMREARLIARLASLQRLRWFDEITPI